MKNFKLLKKVEHWKFFSLTAMLFVLTAYAQANSSNLVNENSNTEITKIKKESIVKELGAKPTLIDGSSSVLSAKAKSSIIKVEALIQSYFSKADAASKLNSVFTNSKSSLDSGNEERIISFLNAYQNYSADKIQIEDNQISDYATFMTAFTYITQISEWQVHPKLVYRGVKNYDDILDMGMEIRTPDDQLGFMSMYHTNKSMSFGLSYQKVKQWQLLVLYNTPVQALKSYATGTFEAGLQLNVGTIVKGKK